MSVKANGTDAKDIALHFLNLTEGRATKAIMGKTIMQAKSILEAGYTKEEILMVIDFIISTKNIQMYSLGYVSASINDALREAKKHKEQQENKLKMEQLAKEQRVEVSTDEQVRERNRARLERLGIQSTIRRKHSLDMFEGK